MATVTPSAFCMFSWPVNSVVVLPLQPNQMPEYSRRAAAKAMAKAADALVALAGRRVHAVGDDDQTAHAAVLPKGVETAAQPFEHRVEVVQAVGRLGGPLGPDQHAVAAQAGGGREAVLVGQIVADEHRGRAGERRLAQEGRDRLALVLARRAQLGDHVAELQHQFEPWARRSAASITASAAEGTLR